MGLFGSKQTVFLKYQINLTDPAKVASLQGGPKGSPTEKIEPATPVAAAAKYAIPIEDQNTSPFTYPCITSEWFTPGASNNWPRDQTGFTRKSGGWFGMSFLFGDTTTYYWRGEFNLVPAETGPGGAVPAVCAQRRAVTGFEFPISGDGNSGTGSLFARAASRSIQGYGFVLDSNAAANVTQTFNDKGGAARADVWNRFYFRARRFPTAACTIYFERGTVNGTAGLRLDMLPSGQMAANCIDTGGIVSLKQSSTQKLAVHTWYKVDVLTNWSTGLASVYINGALALGPLSDISINGGVHLVQNALSAILGTSVANDACFHFDDWITADAPDGTLSSLDWVNGSRVLAVRPNGLAASNDGNWLGDWRSLCARSTLAGGNNAQMTSIVASSVLAVTTDAAIAVDQEQGSIGFVALQVSMSSGNTVPGTFGFKLPGGADVLIAEVGGTTGAPVYTVNLYRPAALAVPVATGLAGLELKHVKGTGIAQSTVNSFGASVELIGTFGPEDLPATTTDTTVGARAMSGLQNAQYPRSAWARKGIAPISPVGVQSGTYVGTGTLKEVTFQLPPCFILIRNTANSACFWWIPSMNHAKKGGGSGYFPSQVADILQDPTFVGSGALDAQETQYVMRLTGTDAEVNQVGVTYAYTAFCDPGQRFTTSGCLYANKGATDIVTNLESGIFTPEYVMVRHEVSGAGGTFEWVKGLGHAATNVSPLAAAETASALSMSNGTLTTKAAFHAPTLIADLTQGAYMAWRRDDKSKDTALTAVLWLTSYTGDGSASRAITFPVSGVRPLFALVTPHNGASFYRDTAHTGTTSSQWPGGANAATAIVSGGVDQLSVGSALNTNGVIFDVFVLGGGSAAGNGGFSAAGFFSSVAPGNPESGDGTQYDPTPLDPEGPANEDEGDGGGTGDGSNPGDETNFGTQCVGASTQVINIALSRLGISKRVTDIVAELSEEADTCRLHYSEDVDATLRDFPWPFATRYADLVLVAGTVSTPVNGDWQYAYRVPANMMRARRIVNPNGVGRGYDAHPPKFRVGADDVADLIYTNEVDANLEYTVRPSCAASAGDAIFRSALAWRHAHSIAGALSRDAKKQLYCWQMYQSVLVTAATVASTEQQQAKQGGPDWITTREGSDLGPDPWGRG